ncbi:very short patch repair endonuclease [Fulvitalea axinellae]|uniref:Very short patch repair endonuclease n=1 Tax=Fulvitalea axinellae TaxID=1182444 RepID=A0AAU9CS26_9BACT|nr:very short patch repair endonuclease [Fulvitalea axinellae]
MADIFEPEVRSYIMSRIRSKDTKPELKVRRYLHARGFRYSLHSKHLPGKPDLVLRKYKTVIFVNGCFWHGHENCPEFRPPKSNKGFWLEKIRRNKARDRENVVRLMESGWNVIIVWGCELRPKRALDTLENLCLKIRKMKRVVTPEPVS